MKIITREESISVAKPEGTNVRYYLRNEYEVHYNEQVAGSTQTWHHHEKILETIYIIDGELTAEWKVENNMEKQIVKTGDLIETENTPHTFTNHTDKMVKFLVI
ncbi:MAG: cupin domain-containing protein, partial [Bacteroidales bacterium]|nr:cupin domain-containing protein [Bacteroidales bacterium]